MVNLRNRILSPEFGNVWIRTAHTFWFALVVIQFIVRMLKNTFGISSLLVDMRIQNAKCGCKTNCVVF